MLSKYFQQLPVSKITNAVNQELEKNQCVVITAPPGAGKSTLLPLTILEGLRNKSSNEFVAGKILMLEPRRLAARQVAERMATMLEEPVGNTVGYRVRFENKVSKETQIEVLTEGILTRMLVDDPTLDGVSTIIFDEFHERSIHSDVSLALAREIQQVLRPDLRLVFMSATIDATNICRALDAQLIESEGRMFPVEVIHTTEEATSQNVAELVAHTVRQALNDQDGDILAFLPGEGEIRRCQELLQPLEHSFADDCINHKPDRKKTLKVFPLYGLLSPQEQKRAILPSRDGERKIVLSTPIAETSLTIEGIKIVIDSGLCRTLVYDAQRGLSHLETVRISRDMATQRMGRAGRLSSGVCYRLWSLATEHRMAECRQPEILTADLSPMLLDVAAWGESDTTRLPWLTPPPSANLRQSLQLLTLLGAIDAKGNITAHGKQMAKLPCHPRISQMLLSCRNDVQRALAADIAALLEEKDPLTLSNKDGLLFDADINSRLISLRELRENKKGNAYHYQRIIRIAEQYRHLVHVPEDNHMIPAVQSGALIAQAYPERVAKIVSAAMYQLASGDRVHLEQRDDLTAFDWLAVAAASNGRIFLASPVDVKDLRSMGREKVNVSWDAKRGQIVAQRELRIGSLLIESKPIHDIDNQQIIKLLAEAAKKDGRSMFDFSDAVQNLQQRIVIVSEWHPELELPALDTDAFLNRADEWLPFFAGKATTANELKKIDLCAALWSLLSYEQQQAVDQIAPSHIVVPTGSRIRVEYRLAAELPVLRVRLQECFGLTDTPRVDKGQKPVLMELLSPGFKPVQLTQDLRSFWQGTYFEVRKELKRRYPKHSWPEDPLDATPTRGVKRN